MVGRPSVYREQTATKVLESIACGATLDQACEQHGLKAGTVACWAYRDYRGFRQRYFEAFGINALVEASRCIRIVDEVADTDSMARVQAARTRADMRWRIISRLVPEFAEQPVTLHAAVHVYVPDNHRAGDDARVIEGEAQQVLESPDD
jgi:hypothetical protein